MSQLPILKFPDPRLREVAKPLDRVDKSLWKTFDDMLETMYAAPGVGLAATQVGIAQRFTVLDVSEGHDSPLILINPEIISGEHLCDVDEGCLSVPGHYDRVKRYERLRFRAQNPDGQWFEQEAEGLFAQAIQHEIDHLDGKLFVDYLSSLKRERIRKRLEKELRAQRG